MSPLLHACPDWVEVVSLACCVGVLVCARWVVGAVERDAPLAREALFERMPRLLGVSSAGLVASSIVALLVRAAEMSGRPTIKAVAAVPTVLLQTHVGHAWLVRMAAVAVLTAVTVRARGAPRSRLLLDLMLGCALVVAAMDSASGHASDAGDFSVAELMDWLHLTAALVWGGGLLVLSLAILPPVAREGDGAASSMAGVASRFSTLAGPAAVLIVLTAAYQGWVHAGTVADLPRSPFGQAILAKIVLLAVLLGLGAFNRYVSVPRLRTWAEGMNGHDTAGHTVGSARLPQPDDRGSLAAARFTYAVKLEAVLLMAVLLFAALLRHEVPAGHAPLHRAVGQQRRRGRAEQRSAARATTVTTNASRTVSEGGRHAREKRAKPLEVHVPAAQNDADAFPR